MKSIPRLTFLLAVGTLLTAPALGQFRQSYSAPQFTPLDSATTYSYDGANLRRFSTILDGRFLHEIHPPSGAALQTLRFHACDTNATENTGAFLFKYDKDGGNPVFVGGGATTGMPGCGSWDYPIIPPQVVNDGHLVITVITDAGNATTSFAGVCLIYGVPPGPLTPTFSDVPTSHPFYRFIELLASYKITSGCGDTNFCPDRPLTRGEMAVFIIRAKFSDADLPLRSWSED
jgi:hypothetical protein